jgi:Flp pilus assembly protein TadG
LHRLLAHARALLADRSGSTAILFTASIVPMVIAAGVAVDYGRALRLKTYLRSAADSAALAAASARNLEDAQRVTLGEQVFLANVINKVAVTPAVTVSNGIVNVTASSASQSTLMRVAGVEQMDVAVTARAKVPVFTGEIVMVLDYSSSMTNGAGGGLERWQAMRDAAVEMIQGLKNGQANPGLKVGLVPFAHAVYLSLPGEHVLGGTPGVTWTNCTMDRKWPYVIQDSTPTADIATKWGRTDSNDTIGASEYSECPSYASRGLVVRPLSSSHSTVISQIQSMTPYEGTNITTGLSIGWHVISPNAPFGEGGAYGSVDKTIILLTDGEQTMESFGSGGSWSIGAAEQNLADMCTAIKAQGTRIIAVAFSNDMSAATRSRLQACASPGGFYHNPQTGSELADAFRDMTAKIGGRAMLLE